MHRSFVAEAYRIVERAHGGRPHVCIAAGSRIHVGFVLDLAKHLGIELVTTRYGVKNAADKELVRLAKSLDFSVCRTIVVGSGDRGFLKWFRDIRVDGLRLECVARDHQICKEAGAKYDALYRMDTKRMQLPSPSDIRTAVIDCIPEIEVAPVSTEYATGMLRASRIAPKNAPGLTFFQRHSGIFEMSDNGLTVGLIKETQ